MSAGGHVQENLKPAVHSSFLWIDVWRSTHKYTILMTYFSRNPCSVCDWSLLARENFYHSNALRESSSSVRRRYAMFWVNLRLVKTYFTQSPADFVLFPCSLRVSLDLGKVVYSWMIIHDKNIPGTVVRSSTIPEELGRIGYLLSDKTGTLTENEMVRHF